jgi:hypothetical protein
MSCGPVHPVSLFLHHDCLFTFLSRSLCPNIPGHQPLLSSPSLPCLRFCFVPQVFTQVDSFASTMTALKDAGMKVNSEESELVYKGLADVEVSWVDEWG